MENKDQIDKFIQSRRAVFPAMYTDEEIEEGELLEVLENARWAPSHRLTQPWRFVVFRGEALQDLSNYLGDYYQKHTSPEKYSEMKYKKTVSKPLKSACVLAIVMHRHPHGLVPEWEEIAAVSMAVQNIWLSCSTRGIGAYWSSPESALNASTFLGLADNEKCLGLFYMGRQKVQPAAPERIKTEEYVRYFQRKG